MNQPVNKKVSDEDFLVLYHQGLSDIKIAKIFNVSKTAIRLRRCKFKLVANFNSGNPNTELCSPEQLKDYRKKNCYINKVKRDSNRYRTEEEFRKKDNKRCSKYYSKNLDKRKQQMRRYCRNRRATSNNGIKSEGRNGK